MRYASKASLGLVVVGSSLIACGCAKPPTTDFLHDFGVQLPNDPVKASWWVVNPGTSPLVLGGFENACGCQAWVDGNPVVPASGKVRLNMSTVAGGSPGPHGVFFNLTEEGGRAEKKIVRYILKWSIPPMPSFAPDEIAFRPGTPDKRTVSIKNAERFDLKVLTAPKGVSARLVRSALEISYDGSVEANGRIELQAGSQIVSLACRPEHADRVALQPWRLALRRGETGQVRTFGNYATVSPAPGLAFSHHADALGVAVSPFCVTGRTLVKLLDRKGEVVSELPVEVVE